MINKYVLQIARLLTEDPDIILEETFPNTGEVAGDQCVGCGQGELVLRSPRGGGFFLGCSRYPSGCEHQVQPNAEEQSFKSEFRGAFEEEDYDAARQIAQNWMNEKPQSTSGQKALKRIERRLNAKKREADELRRHHERERSKPMPRKHCNDCGMAYSRAEENNPNLHKSKCWAI